MPSIQSLLKATLQEPRTLGREGGGDAGKRNLPLTTACAPLKQTMTYIEGTQFCRVEKTPLLPGSVPTTPSVSLHCCPKSKFVWFCYKNICLQGRLFKSPKEIN